MLQITPQLLLAPYQRLLPSQTRFTQHFGCLERGRARLSPEEGALFLRAMDVARRELWDTRPAERSAAQERAEALALIADKALSGAARPGAERTMVMVHVEGEVLKDAELDGESRIDGGKSVPAETSRRLACDASVVQASENGEDPPRLGRRTRVVSTTLRRALHVRDHGRCRFPGCSCRITDANHIEHWANGGATVLGNIILLCRFHHTLVHEGKFRVDGSAGTLRFYRPDGCLIPEAPGPAQFPAAEYRRVPQARVDLGRWVGRLRRDRDLAAPSSGCLSPHRGRHGGSISAPSVPHWLRQRMDTPP